MHRRKLTPTKKGKRARTEPEGSTGEQFDGTKFRDAEREARYDVIKEWTFIPERMVDLLPDEYTEFTDELQRRKWMTLAHPMCKFDPDVVKEFYANAWPVQGGRVEKRSKVRGHWVPYDRDAINSLLGNPMNLDSGELCWYQTQRKKVVGFNDVRTARLLCVPGKSFETNHAGQPLRILRGSMTTLTQIWMSFILANIVPMLHTSDLNLPRCYLLYTILNRFGLDIATIISEEIHQFVISEPIRKQEQSRKPLGFPSLITSLCASHGVVVHPSKNLRPPIDRKFIEKYCTHTEHQAAEPPLEAPGPSSQHESSSYPTASSVTDQLQRLELHMQHLHAQQASTHRGQLHLHQSFYTLTQQLQTKGPYSWPTPEEFSTYVSWPGDSPGFSSGAGVASGSADDHGNARDVDEDMHDPLDDLI